MDFTEAVRYIESLSIQGWRLGNARFEAFLERLGNPHLKFPCVHITGTNGKGSTTTLISSILRAAGYRVGTYISPHVFDIRERILINGELISKELFCEGVAMMRPLIERLNDTEYGLITEFEIKTALAFWAFAQAQVDIIVLEVGLGGRMDATNVVTPELSVIVSIGLDHTDRLGATHRDIAYEKAGIIKPNRPVVSGAIHPEAVEMIAQVAAAQGAPLYQVLRSTDVPSVQPAEPSRGTDAPSVQPAEPSRSTDSPVRAGASPSSTGVPSVQFAEPSRSTDSPVRAGASPSSTGVPSVQPAEPSRGTDAPSVQFAAPRGTDSPVRAGASPSSTGVPSVQDIPSLAQSSVVGSLGGDAQATWEGTLGQDAQATWEGTLGQDAQATWEGTLGRDAQATFLYTPLPSPTDSAVRVQRGEWELALQPYLIGDYQRHNTACAVAAACVLRERGYRITDAAIEQGVRTARLPGRLQVVSESPRIVLDGAHNPDAAAVLANALPRLFKYRQLILVIGMLAPHEPLDTLKRLLPITDIAIFTAIDNPRAHAPTALLEAAQHWQSAKPHRTPRLILTADSPEQAFDQALAIADMDDLILVTGSFYLIGLWRAPYGVQ